MAAFLASALFRAIASLKFIFLEVGLVGLAGGSVRDSVDSSRLTALLGVVLDGTRAEAVLEEADVPPLEAAVRRVVDRGEGGARSRGLLGGTSPEVGLAEVDGTRRPVLEGVFLGVFVGTLDILLSGSVRSRKGTSVGIRQVSLVTCAG